MRRWHAQTLLAIACVLSCQPWLFAQVLLAGWNPETRDTKGCATPPDSRPSGPEVRIAELNFEGDLRMPSAEQREIAASLSQRAYSGQTDEVASEVLERVRAAWQDRGYFRVQVGGEAKVLTSGPASERITVTVQVDEGQQYRLGGIGFKNNRANQQPEGFARPISPSGRRYFPPREGRRRSRTIALCIREFRLPQLHVCPRHRDK
jgi:hypothetical protein